MCDLNTKKAILLTGFDLDQSLRWRLHANFRMVLKSNWFISLVCLDVGFYGLTLEYLEAEILWFHIADADGFLF